MLWISRRLKAVVGKLPGVGDQVWWAPKQLGCIVTARDLNGNFTFQGGEIVRNKRGREVPRWTVMAGLDSAKWDESSKMWIVGEGPAPKNVRGVVIVPTPVVVSGQSKGGFAN